MPKGQDVVMKGKTYKRTIMANANAQIVVPLDKKYTRFEAEIDWRTALLQVR